jgi:hypothetical protein
MNDGMRQELVDIAGRQAASRQSPFQGPAASRWSLSPAPLPPGHGQRRPVALSPVARAGRQRPAVTSPPAASGPSLAAAATGSPLPCCRPAPVASPLGRGQAASPYPQDQPPAAPLPAAATGPPSPRRRHAPVTGGWPVAGGPALAARRWSPAVQRLVPGAGRGQDAGGPACRQQPPLPVTYAAGRLVAGDAGWRLIMAIWVMNRG